MEFWSDGFEVFVMKDCLTTFGITIGLASGLIACGSQPAEVASPSPQPPTQSTPVAADGMGKRLTFRCAGGKAFTASFAQPGAPKDVAIVNLPDQGELTLPQVPSGSGAKYSNDKVTVWNKGDTAFVEVEQKVILDDCKAAL
jgi:membrane-bound inhibitor of C-type lysozyme